MARGPLASAVVVLGTALVLSAGLFLLGRHRVREEERRAEEGAGAALSELRRDLEAALGAAEQRAAGLAASPTLRAAVATDQRTVADMVAKDLALAPRPDETMELFQVPRGRGPISLLRLPLDGPPAPVGASGAVLAPSGDGVLCTVTVPVDPAYRQTELRGLLAVTLRIDAHRLAERLGALGAAVELEGLTAPLLLGRSSGRAQLRRATVLEPPRVLRPVTALVSVPRGGDGGLRVAALAVGALGLLVGLPLLLRGPRPAPPPNPLSPSPPSSASARAAPSVGSAMTAPGLIAGKYRLERTIGAGGMSEVFLAQAVGEARFEKPVAIKFLLPAYANSAVLDHFLDEARLQAKISHPNVVQIYDLGREAERYFIAMEYVEGLDCAQLLLRLEARRERVPLQQALTIALLACEGLHAAHGATDTDGKPLGLIHRDVKPSNILLGYSGAVKVADFGIAKASVQAHLTVPGQIKGTLAYMAPEQRSGDAIDRRVDVFGMGAVIYELCIGQRIDLDLARLLQLGLQGWPHLQPPSQVRADLPEELDEILWRALAYDPRARFSDCRALGAALEAALLRAGLSPSVSALGEWLAGLRGRPA